MLLRLLLAPRPMLLLAGLGLACASAAAPEALERALAEQQAADREGRAAQTRVEQLDDRSRAAIAEYRALLQETASLKRYNAQLATQMESQEREIAALKEQIQAIEVTARELTPLLQRKLETLDALVGLDLPFLQRERRERVALLTEVLGRADVSVAEKYRRLMEAYQVEMEYGRTLEAYQAPLQGTDAERTVDFLRVGRVALLYRSLDGREAGYWDSERRGFVADARLSPAVRDGLRIARRQAAPDLLVVPVPAAGDGP